jgi:indolepyruvate ferredoxin oxidoreductase, beta subunit
LDFCTGASIGAWLELRPDDPRILTMNTIAPPQSGPPISQGRAPKAITVAILAMGGEGGGVLADWIVDLAEHSGYCAQTTSVPGVAQRTGSTIYYIEMLPEAPSRVAGKDPVFALMPTPGEVDIVIASELMEAARAVQRGFVTSERTTLVASTHRVYSMTEKTALADGQVDTGKLIEACRTGAKTFVHSDFAQVASNARSIISAVLFGALAATKALPFGRDQFQDAVRRGGVGVESSLAAFDAGFAAATESPENAKAPSPAKRKVGPRLGTLATRIEQSFPAPSHDILLAGIERLADYQDDRYAAEYLDYLEDVRDLDAQDGNGNFALLRETARYLALWMSYEDAIRVADLKTRRTRFDRVRKESRSNEKQVLQINEFLYPRIEEITDVMPGGLGRWVLKTQWVKRLIARFTGHGRIVQTTSLRGFVQLYLIASLRPWRRKTLRFHEERKRFTEWLATLAALAPGNPALALEIAESPRVLKGYGDTYVRGRKSFDAMMAALPELRQRSDAGTCLKKLREAALADETGQKLAAALLEVGT